MNTTVSTLKLLINEVIAASSEYMQKERVREILQHVVTDLIKSNKITSQEDLDEFFVSADTAFKSLKMVPFNVYQKMSVKH